MKSPFIASVVTMAVTLHAQSTFQNLDFESAIVPPNPNFGVPMEHAFPGWSGTIGTEVVTNVVFNNFALTTANMSLLSSSYDILPAFQGSYSALLQGSYLKDRDNLLLPPEVSLFQTGLFPESTLSLTFLSDSLSAYHSLSDIGLYVGGQRLSLFVLQEGPEYTLFGADVSAFAGQTTELRFTARAHFINPWDPGMNMWMLDDIRFSDQAIPEPGTVALFGLASFLLLARTRRSSRSQ